MCSHITISHHQIPSSTSAFNSNNKLRRDLPPTSFPNAPVNQTELLGPADPTSNQMGTWSAPTSQKPRRPRPLNTHETGFSYCLPQQYSSLHAWDASLMPQQSEDMISPQDYFSGNDYHNSSATGNKFHLGTPTHQYSLFAAGAYPRHCDDGINIPNADIEMALSQTYTTDENLPVLDLTYSAPGINGDTSNAELPYNSNRISGSSFTMSTSAPLSDMLSNEDLSTTMSETHSLTSEYVPRSNRNSLLSSTQLSPVASPRMAPQDRSGLVRTQSRGRASPSPRLTNRAAPYQVDSSRSKRWSTGSYGPALNRRPSAFVRQQTSEAPNQHSSYSYNSSPTVPKSQGSINVNNFQPHQHPLSLSRNPAYHNNSILLSSQAYGEPLQFPNPAPVLSRGVSRMLQSSTEPHTLHSQYSDLADSPDLYASLLEQPLDPPESDMNSTDPDMVPHEQKLRFGADLYTPRWVRGHGNKREGWCGICKPGRWLVLKNSAFWYDKSFTHGISAATGTAFEEPLEKRRMIGNLDVWEGLCESCGEWVALISSKKKGTTWFRHAYKVSPRTT